MSSGLTCVILAAGKGRRMRNSILEAHRKGLISKDLVNKFLSVPKPLIPYPFPNGKPIVEHILDFVESLGIKNKIIVVSREKYFEEIAKKHDVKIVLQKTPLGTAHALKMALPYITSKLFLVMNGDDIIEFELEENPTIYVKRVKDVSNFGAIVLENGRVIIKEKELKGPGYAYTGSSILEKDVVERKIKYLKKKRGKYMITDLINEVSKEIDFKIKEVKFWKPVNTIFQAMDCDESSRN